MAVSLKKESWEIRWHGRGGQGVVTASNLLASAALRGGLFFRSLPEFGAERSGAPILAYTRVGRSPIYEQGPVTAPDAVVVLDATLIGRVDFLNALKEDGTLIINSSMSPEELRKLLDWNRGCLCTLDATDISMRYLKRNIPNGAILGALARATGAVAKEHLASAIEADLSVRFRPEMVQANLRAFEAGYKEALLG